MPSRSKQRAPYRGIVSKALSALEAELSEPQCTEEVGTLLTALQRKNLKLEEQNELVLQEMENASESELEEEILGAEEIRDRVERAVLKAERLLNRHQQVDSQPGTMSVDVPERNSPNGGLAPSSRSSLTQQVRLPTIALPEFRGDIFSWASFWDSFRTLVHENDEVPEIMKFNYLKAQIKAPADQTIVNLAMTSVNYQIAVELLKQRYGQPSVVRAALSQRVIAAAPVRSSSDVIGLRKFLDLCEASLRGISDLSPQTEDSPLGATCNEGSIHVLTPLIMSKLPEDLLMEFNQATKESNLFDLSSLMSFLRNHVLGKERYRLLTGLHSKGSQQAFRTTDPNPSALALRAATGNAGCNFCNGMHRLSECGKFRNMHRTERFRLVKRYGVCFSCLEPGHIKAKCPRYASDRSQASGTSEPSTVMSVKCRSSQILQTATAVLKGPRGQNKVRLMLDSGSERTYVLRSTARKLACEVVGQEELALQTFGNNSSVHKTFPRVKLELYHRAGNFCCELQALECPTMCAPVAKIPQTQQLVELQSKFELADEITYQNDCSQIDILVGADNYWKIVEGETIKLNDSLGLMKSCFGYIVLGSIGSSPLGPLNHCYRVSASQMLELDKSLKQFWDLESVGILPDAAGPIKEENRMAIEGFNLSVKRRDQRYSVGLVWKQEMQQALRNNYFVAEKRLQSSLKRFQRFPGILTRYHEEMRKLLDCGYAEKVEAPSCGNAWYLPHHAVIREDSSTTKMRIVFDASAENHGLSLNDCLLSGPALSPEIFDMLVNFRVNEIAFTADIQKAFLQVGIKEEDRDFLRFLWYENLEAIKCAKQPQIFRMKRVVFGVACSPFLLSATLHHHLRKYDKSHPVIVKCLLDGLYVDDWLCGASTEEEALQRATDGRNLLAEAGMKMHKWLSNSTLVSELNEAHGIADETKNLGCDESKVLGVLWEPKSDCLGFSVYIPDQVIPTKRVVARVMAKQYDPLGLAAPVILKGKVLLKELWTTGFGWDDELDGNLKKKFCEWMNALEKLKTWKIPRWYGLARTSSGCLHVFCDASEVAFGAAVYLTTSTDFSAMSSLVASKSRPAPTKRVTLPRLELLACVLGARLMDRVRKKLGALVSKCICWTDSMVALAWICGASHRWKTFVANRVEEIQTLTEPSQWHHVRSAENPADLVSRATTMNSEQQKFWLNGPTWLTLAEADWPSCDSLSSDSKVILAEQKKTTVVQVNVQVAPVMDIEAFSSWNRLIRVTCWLLRFVQNARQPAHKTSGQLTVEELNNAETKWLAYLQAEAFYKERHALCNSLPIDANSKLKTLRPYLDESQILRISGRVQFSELPAAAKHQILLPSHGRVIELLVTAVHERLLHASTRDVLVELRQRYWLLSGRRTVRRILSSCLVCRRDALKPYNQAVAPLPAVRVCEPVRPFLHVGMDFAGPIYVRCHEQERKCYVLLITCTTTRAIHLEVTLSQSLTDFMNAFQRFIARRGICQTIISDNAKTFKAAASLLATKYKVKWKYITERAPWQGGFWERMVRSVKEPLRRVLGRSQVTLEALSTLVCQIEGIVNSRPITSVSDDVTDPQPLTPAHFLIGDRLVSIPVDQVPEGRNTLDRMYCHRKKLLRDFWLRWSKEYLGQLQGYRDTSNTNHEIRVGDVVLVSDDNIRRHMWPIGVIREVLHGKDGLVRSVIVFSRGRVITRPVQRLYKLEGSSEETQLNVNSDDAAPTEAVTYSEEHATSRPQVTRRGRTVKVPARMDL